MQELRGRTLAGRHEALQGVLPVEGRPAVEPLQHDVEIQFGPFTPSPRFDWFRRRFGREAKYVMEANGYRLAQRGVYIGGKVFTKGSRYDKI